MAQKSRRPAAPAPAPAAAPAPAPSGPPRWTYGLGAIVGAAGLVWTIASYFIPKPEPAKPPAPPAVPITTPAPPAPAPSVSGSGNVVIGRDMTGGQIVVNAPVPPAPSASAASRP